MVGGLQLIKRKNTKPLPDYWRELTLPDKARLAYNAGLTRVVGYKKWEELTPTELQLLTEFYQAEPNPQAKIPITSEENILTSAQYTQKYANVPTPETKLGIKQPKFTELPLGGIERQQPQVPQTIPQAGIRGRHTRLPALGETIVMTPEEARADGYEISSNMRLKLVGTGDINNPRVTLVSPFGQEVTGAGEIVPKTGEGIVVTPEMEIADLTPKIFPGFTADELPALIQEDTDLFVKGIGDYGRTPEMERYLALLGISPEDVDTIFGEAITDKAIKQVFGDVTREELGDWAEENPNLFVDKLRVGGRTPEKEQMLRSVGATPEAIEEIFSVSKIVAPVSGVRQLVNIKDNRAFDNQGKWVGTYNPVTREFEPLPDESIGKDIWDALYFGTRGAIQQTKQFPNVLGQFLFRDLTPVERKIWGDAEADRINNLNREMRDSFRTSYAESYKQFEEWKFKHPELQSQTWLIGLVESVPLMVGALGITATGVALGQPVLGALGGLSIMTPAQTTDVYDSLVNAGANEDQAALLALPVGGAIAAIEILADLPYLKTVAPSIFKLLRGEIRKEMSEAVLESMAKKGLKTFTQIEVTETLEEVAQQVVQNAAVKVFNENKGLFDDLGQTAAGAALLTAPLAVFGGAGVAMARVSPSEIQGKTPDELKAQGLWQDVKTGKWYKRLAEAIKGEEGSFTPFAEMGGESWQVKLGKSDEAKLVNKLEGEKARLLKASVDEYEKTRGPSQKQKDIQEKAHQNQIQLEKAYEAYHKKANELQSEPTSESEIADYQKYITDLKKDLETATPEQVEKISKDIQYAETRIRDLQKVSKVELISQVEAEKLNQIFIQDEIRQHNRRVSKRPTQASRIEASSEAIEAWNKLREAGYRLKSSMQPELGFNLQQVIPVTPEVTKGMNLPDLDAQVRDIIPPKKGQTDWTVEIGLQESSGEAGGDIVTWTYTSVPTMAEIRSDILREYQTTKAEINKESAMGVVAKSGRDEAIEDAIDKVLKIQPAIPTAELGQPEAGLQPSMLPEEVTAKEVRPKGKGKVTQISMEDQLKLEQARKEGAQIEIEALQNELADNRASDLIGLIKKTGKMKGEFDNLTIAQYKNFTGKRSVKPSILAPDGKHVRWEYALDELADERGYKSEDDLRKATLRAKEIKDRITELKGGAEPSVGFVEEAPAEEVTPAEPIEPPPIEASEQSWKEYVEHYYDTKPKQTIIPPETLELVSPPVKPPPPTEGVTPESEIPERPTGGEIERIIKQSEEQVKQVQPRGIIKLGLKIPGIKQTLTWFAPAYKMMGDSQRIHVSMIAEESAKSDVLTWADVSRYKLLRTLRDAFGKDALRGGKTDVKFKGTPKQEANEITYTLKDIADNPELYELSEKHLGALASIEVHNNMLLDWIKTEYNVDVGQFIPKENGAFLPNVDISEDVMEYLKSETRAVATGRGKTRVWKTARDRMGGKTPFKPELDVQKLLEGLDMWKANAAGGQTFKTAIGGLTRDEAIAETHPDLGKRMNSLKDNLAKLRQARDVNESIKRSIDAFIQSAKEDIDLQALSDGLASGGDELTQLIESAEKQRPKFAQTAKDLNLTIRNIRNEIADLRPFWKSANPKPYIFVQEGIYRYFPSDMAKMIVESRKVSNNVAIRIADSWRGGAFSGDFSPYTNQGQIGLFAHPFVTLKAAMGGLRTATQQHQWNRSFNIEALMDDVSNNPIEWSEYASLKGRRLIGTPEEFGGGFLKKIPKFSEFNAATYVVVTRSGFNLWKITYKNLMKAGVPELEAKVAAEAHESKIYPFFNPTKVGLSQARGGFLRSLPTSISFMVQPATMMKQATEGFGKLLIGKPLTPQESMAVKTVVTGATSTLIVSATSAAISAATKGGDDDDIKKAIWDAINPDPLNGKFASLIIGGVRIPLGGPYRALFRALYPQDVPGVPIPLPFYGLLHYDLKRNTPAGFLWNRINPAIKAQITLMMNKDYYGQPVLKGNAWEVLLRSVLYEMEAALPLTIQAGAEALRQGEKYREDVRQQMIAQFMGVNLIKLDNTFLDRQIKQLGLPTDTEAKPYTIQEPDLYSTRDLWGDAQRILRETPPEQMSRRTFDKRIIAIAEAGKIKEQLDILPNEKLIKINAEQAKGDTFIQYYDQWQERQKITDETKLKEFDAKYPKAYLGNITQSEYVLLTQYHNLEGKAQSDFLKAHPELEVNKRESRLKSNPKENAQLAIWGQAKLMTLESYKEFKKLVDKLDTPESALPERTLPPEKSVESYFKYQDMDNKNSWEAQLLVAKDDELRNFLEREVIETPIASLELKTEKIYRETYDKIKTLSDKESPDYIKDDKKRQDEVNKLKDTKIGDLTYRDVGHKIQAIEIGTNEKPTDPKIVDAWVEYGRKSDERPGYDSETKVWLLDNKYVHKWALDNKLLTDDGSDWNEPVLRINVRWREQDKSYDALLSNEQREAYLTNNLEYRNDRYRRKAYSVEFPERFIETYVRWYTDEDLQRPKDLPSNMGWYEDDWFLMENPDFHQALVEAGVFKQLRNFSNVPTREQYRRGETVPKTPSKPKATTTKPRSSSSQRISEQQKEFEERFKK